VVTATRHATGDFEFESGGWHSYRYCLGLCSYDGRGTRAEINNLVAAHQCRLKPRNCVGREHRVSSEIEPMKIEEREHGGRDREGGRRERHGVGMLGVALPPREVRYILCGAAGGDGSGLFGQWACATPPLGLPNIDP
jgi:hypothetical protein